MLRRMICTGSRKESLKIPKGVEFFQSQSRSQEHQPPTMFRYSVTSLAQIISNTSHMKTMLRQTPKYLLFQGNSIQGYDACEHSVENECVISKKFISCEG